MSYKPAVGFSGNGGNWNAETFRAAVQYVARPGSTVPTGKWRAYRVIKVMGCIHKTVKHSVNFVEPAGTQTQTIESSGSEKNVK